MFRGRWLWGLVLFVPLPDAFALDPISPNRECSTCHIMWLTEFRRDDVTPLIPYEPRPTVSSGQQDVVSTERMCFSCHDGFVLDSRMLWAERGHAHPVGVVPTDEVVIPTSRGKDVFPLNDDGRLYCGSCHTAHGVEWRKGEATLFLRMKNVDSSLCIACHLERSTGADEGNHPIHRDLPELPDQLEVAGAQL